jgi:hypothetical protein
MDNLVLSLVHIFTLLMNEMFDQRGGLVVISPHY